MPAGNSPRSPQKTDAPGLDRLSVQEALQVLEQLAGAGVAVAGPLGKRLERDRLQIDG